MNVKIDEKRNMMIVEMPLQAPAPSASGKTLIIASTRGFTATAAQYKGKAVSLSLNATIAK